MFGFKKVVSTDRAAQNGVLYTKDEAETGKKYGILSKNYCMDRNVTRTRLNNNVLVMGNHGSGRTMEYILPNLLQAVGSYVVLDKKGELHEKAGKFLEKNGYDVKVLNVKDPVSGIHYDPLAYIKTDQDIYDLIEYIIHADGPKFHERLFDALEHSFLSAVFLYAFHHMPEEKLSFGLVKKLIDEAGTADPAGSGKTLLDLRFEKLKEVNEDCATYKFYARVKRDNPRTVKSVLISAMVHLQMLFMLGEAGFMDEDGLKLGDFFDKKCALFIRVSDDDPADNRVLATLACRQILTAAKAHEKEKGTSEGNVLVRMMLDNFADACYIPDLLLDVSVGRRYGISYDIVMEREEQLKTLYADKYKTLIDNFATTVFFGPSGPLGDQTYADRLRGTGMATIPAAECVICVQGQEPIRDEKCSVPVVPA